MFETMTDSNFYLSYTCIIITLQQTTSIITKISNRCCPAFLRLTKICADGIITKMQKVVMITNPKYQRSSNYRAEFMRHWPPDSEGYYRCVYCGRKIKKDKMQVDHIISVDMAQKNWFSRPLLPKSGVNDLSNLVPACQRCNRKKDRYGGFWIIRGRYWKFFMPFYRLRPLFVLLLFGILFAFVMGILGKQPFRDFLFQLSPTLENLLRA